MIEVVHSLTITARCPKDETEDRYDATLTVFRVVPVEDILAAIARATERPAFQEDITRMLADELEAQVVTHGVHSGVETTCKA